MVGAESANPTHLGNWHRSLGQLYIVSFDPSAIPIEEALTMPIPVQELLAWNGPFVGEFALHSTHTKTIRYHRRLDRHGFDFYVPENMFPDQLAAPPTLIRVCVARSEAQVPQYFERVRQNNTTRRLVVSCVWPYDFLEEKSCSRLYRAGWDYSLYVPNEAFHGKSPPDRVYAAVGFFSS
jgi:hypothetical protein